MSPSTSSLRGDSVEPGRAGRSGRPIRLTPFAQGEPFDRTQSELDLHQLTTDEALLKINQYLNDAVMAGLYQVRIVHGKGSGTLRDFVRRELSRHPLVSSFRPGGKGEGGVGATVALLR